MLLTLLSNGCVPIDQLLFDSVTFDQLPFSQLPLDYCAICPISQLTNSHLITAASSGGGDELSFYDQVDNSYGHCNGVYC